MDNRTIDIHVSDILMGYVYEYGRLDTDGGLPTDVNFRLVVSECYDFNEVYDHFLEIEFDPDVASAVVAERQEYLARLEEGRRRSNHRGSSFFGSSSDWWGDINI